MPIKSYIPLKPLVPASIFLPAVLLACVLLFSCGNRDEHAPAQAAMTPTTATPAGAPIPATDSGLPGGPSPSSFPDLSTLLRPANSFVVSSIPVTTLQQDSRQLDLESFGAIAYDDRQTSTIAARVSGRIRRLYVKYRYQHIHKGDRIMDVYSPELLTAQQDLLFLLRQDAGNLPLIEAARQKLSLLGMSEAQLTRITQTGQAQNTVTVFSDHTGHIHEAGSMASPDGAQDTPLPPGSPVGISGDAGELPLKEGMYVQKGQTIFQLYNTDKVWIVLHLFADKASLVKQGVPVTLTAETRPGESFPVKIDYLEPFYASGSKTLTARIYFDNTAAQLPIGSQVKAVLHVHTGAAAWLPRTSVLTLGVRQVVLQKTTGGFKVHPVETGITTPDKIQILGGLNGQDSVAANAQFLMDSESFIKIQP